MSEKMMPVVVLIPFITAALIPILPFRKREARNIFIEVMVLLNSVLVFLLLWNRPEATVTLFRFTGNLSITMKIDGIGAFYAGLVAFLWPLATLYSFEYMKHEHNEKSFFLFYVVTYGVTLGVAMAENILTLYFFFEMLSLITLPLVMHTRTREAILAARTYLYYMLGGAAFAFIGMIYILTYGTTPSFVPGGVLTLAGIGGNTFMLEVIYVLCFCGFAVKTALWPFSSWLPKAGVAPTPVTALLHAVAVVNTGAFAALRVTYFSFGTELLKDTWAQKFIMCLIMFTIVYGCSRAVKETHLKRRLAWSTVSNLSYILFGVILMSDAGLTGALSHMLFHSFMKISAFFCAGAIICKTGRNYVHELDGLGRKMKGVFAVYTVSSLALMGVPGLCGFVSKWYLAKAAVEADTMLSYIGVGALLVSALLTAIYMMTVVVRAFFPGKDFEESVNDTARDPGWRMMLPLAIFVIGMILFGVASGPVMKLLTDIAAGTVGKLG